MTVGGVLFSIKNTTSKTSTMMLCLGCALTQQTKEINKKLKKIVRFMLKGVKNHNCEDPLLRIIISHRPVHVHFQLVDELALKVSYKSTYNCTSFVHVINDVIG